MLFHDGAHPLKYRVQFHQSSLYVQQRFLVLISLLFLKLFHHNCSGALVRALSSGNIQNLLGPHKRGKFLLDLEIPTASQAFIKVLHSSLSMLENCFKHNCGSHKPRIKLLLSFLSDLSTLLIYISPMRLLVKTHLDFPHFLIILHVCVPTSLIPTMSS